MSNNNGKIVIEVEISREAFEFLRLIVSRDNKGLNGELHEFQPLKASRRK